MDNGYVSHAIYYYSLLLEMMTVRMNEIEGRIVQLKTIAKKAEEEKLELYRELAILRSFRKEEKVAAHGANRDGSSTPDTKYSESADELENVGYWASEDEGREEDRELMGYLPAGGGVWVGDSNRCYDEYGDEFGTFCRETNEITTDWYNITLTLVADGFRLN